MNVIAHSKGGLDTRVAIFKRPDLFNGLITLATPHKGAWLANEVCAIRQLPGGGVVAAAMGPCDDSDDGLYNLQTPYMDFANTFLRENGAVEYHALAGNCIGSTQGPLACGPSNLFNGCPIGGDTVVCVGSAWGLTTAEDPDRGMNKVLPQFFANHTGMRKRCPALRGLFQVYAPFMDNLNVEDGDCARGDDDGDSTLIIAAQVRAGFGDIDPGTLLPSSVDSASADIGSPAVIPVNGASLIRLYVPDEVSNEITAQASDGTSQVVQAEAVPTGIPSVRVLQLQPDEETTLTVTSDGPADVGVIRYAENVGVDEPTAEGLLTGSNFELAVTIPKADASTTAAFRTSDGTELPLTTADGTVFTGALPVTAGAHATGSIVVAGNVDRLLPVTFATVEQPDAITGLGGEALADVDGDGLNDSIEVEVSVFVDRPVDYLVTADLTDVNTGATITATGSGLVTATGAVPIRVGFDALTETQSFGPFIVSNVVVAGPNLEFIDAFGGNLGTTTTTYDPTEVAGRVSRTDTTVGVAGFPAAGTLRAKQRTRKIGPGLGGRQIDQPATRRPSTSFFDQRS